MREYHLLADQINDLCTNPSMKKQAHETFLELYTHAAKTYPSFRAVVESLSARLHEGGVSVELNVCDTLKKCVRIAEKARLRRGSEGSVAGVKDIVRSMAVTHRVGYANVLIKSLMGMHKDKKVDLEVVRIKNRFAVPSGGGWRDLVTLSSASLHIYTMRLAKGVSV